MTESELAQDAATVERTPQYVCPLKNCTSAGVDDVSEMIRCEKCDRYVCDSHAVRQSECIGFFICTDCDRAERFRMESLLRYLDPLIDAIRNHIIQACDVEGKLAAMALDVAEMRGQK